MTAFTRRISSQYDQNTQATDPREQEWMERVNIGTLPSAYQYQLVELLRSHQQVFVQDDDDVGLIQTVKHPIYTTDDNPVKAAYRRIPPPQFDEVKPHITDLFYKEIIKPSQSEFASPIVICRKKNGKIRMCVDYRRLNTKTRKDAFPIPRVDEMFDHLAEAK